MNARKYRTFLEDCGSRIINLQLRGGVSLVPTLCVQTSYGYTILVEVLISIEEDIGQLIHTNWLDKSDFEDEAREQKTSRTETRGDLRAKGRTPYPTSATSDIGIQRGEKDLNV